MLEGVRSRVKSGSLFVERTREKFCLAQVTLTTHSKINMCKNYGQQKLCASCMGVRNILKDEGIFPQQLEGALFNST